MPVEKLDIGTAEIVLTDGDDKLTGLTIANPQDATDGTIIYITDEQGKGTDGFPIFEVSYIHMSKMEGFELEKKWWAVASNDNKYVHILKSYRKMPALPEEPKPDLQEPETRHDPSM